MNVLAWLLGVAVFGALALAAISFYLLKVIADLEKEIAELQPPFQASWGAPIRSNPIKFKIDVLSPLYNGVMRKRKHKGIENKPYIEAMRELRKSNAATTHDNRPNRLRTRKAIKTQAIKESY